MDLETMEKCQRRQVILHVIHDELQFVVQVPLPSFFRFQHRAPEPCLEQCPLVLTEVVDKHGCFHC